MKDSMEQAKGQEAYCEFCGEEMALQYDPPVCLNRQCLQGADNLFWARVDYEYDRKKDR